MKLKNITLAAFLMAGASAYGAPVIQCSAGNTLTTYLAADYECEIGDKMYSNFSYTDPAGDPTAGQIMVGVDNQPGILQTGLQFQTTSNTWTVSGFAVSYSISVDPNVCGSGGVYGPTGSTCSIAAAQLSFQGALAPNNAALKAVLSPGGTLSVDDIATSDNTRQLSLGAQPLTSTNVSIDGMFASASAPIDSFGLDVYQTVSSVPEPATLGLLGVGLVGLGLLGRRVSSR
jgi:hypothetical protein